MDRQLKVFVNVSIAIGILVAGLGIGYYFVFALPAKEMKAQQLEENKIKFDQTLKSKEYQDKIDADSTRKNTALSCSARAEKAAIDLLKTKAELSPSYNEAAKKDLYLKDDYDKSYQDCMTAAGY